jgi:hypothetical protein
MIAHLAYLDDPEVKQAALERASSSDSTGWAVEDSDEQRMHCAVRFGLSESLLNLLTHAFHIPYGEHAKSKLSTALAAIAPGADTLALVRDWVLGIWHSEVKRHVAGTPAEQPAAELMRLVEATAGGHVPRDTLRRARRAVAGQAGHDPDLDPFLELLTAMGWDLAASPRATTDIWNMWEATVTAPLNRAAGWEQAVQDDVIQAVRDAHIAVHAQIGAPPQEADGAAAYGARSKELVHAELAANGNLERFEALQSHIMSELMPAMKQWRATAEKSIFEACRKARSEMRIPHLTK